MTDKHKETPDLLGAIIDRTAKQQSDKPASQETSKTAKQQTADLEMPEAPAGEKVKNTYYFSPDTAFDLDSVQLELRRLTGKRLSKSEVIEAAMILAFQDWRERGEQSEIAILLSK